MPRIGVYRAGAIHTHETADGRDRRRSERGRQGGGGSGSSGQTGGSGTGGSGVNYAVTFHPDYYDPERFMPRTRITAQWVHERDEEGRTMYEDGAPSYTLERTEAKLPLYRKRTIRD